MGGYTFAAAATALSACAAAGFESAFDSGFGLGLKKAEIGVAAGVASSAGFGPGLKKAEIVPFDIGVGVGSRGLSRAREGRGEITFQLERRTGQPCVAVCPPFCLSTPLILHSSRSLGRRALGSTRP